MRRSVLTRAREEHARHAWPHTRTSSTSRRVFLPESAVFLEQAMYRTC